MFMFVASQSYNLFGQTLSMLHPPPPPNCCATHHQPLSVLCTAQPEAVLTIAWPFMPNHIQKPYNFVRAHPTSTNLETSTLGQICQRVVECGILPKHPEVCENVYVFCGLSSTIMLRQRRRRILCINSQLFSLYSFLSVLLFLLCCAYRMTQTRTD